jgi:hypothetical protein
MFDWHVLIWLDEGGNENASAKQDRIAAEEQARILLGLGRNLIAIKRKRDRHGFERGAKTFGAPIKVARERPANTLCQR